MSDHGSLDFSLDPGVARSPPCCHGNRAGPGGATGWHLVGHVGVSGGGAVEKVSQQ